MKKIISFSTLLVAALAGQAQLKVGLPAGAPNASAILDASNIGATVKKGFLAPQLQLAGTADATTIVSPAPGLMIYNLAPAGSGITAVTAGYYYNAGTAVAPVWVKLSSGPNFYEGNGTLSSNRIVSLGNNGLTFIGNAKTDFINTNMDYTDTNYAARFRAPLNSNSSILIGGVATTPALGQASLIAASVGTSPFARVRFGAQFISAFAGEADADFVLQTDWVNRLVVSHTGNVGIGVDIPNASAILEASATNKGFLPPRVSLTSALDVSTVLAPATGLLLYNTATAGTDFNAIAPGYYFYDGARWKPLLSEVPITSTPFDASVLGYTPTGKAATAPNDTTISGIRFIKRYINTNSVNGHSYALYTPRNTANTANATINWFSNFNFAKAIGGYMLTMTNQSEIDYIKTAFLSNVAMSMDGTNTVLFHAAYSIWMGFAKIVEPGNPVKLGWITGERSRVNWSLDPSATDNNFQSGEPNNNNGTEGNVHIWATATQTLRTWNDATGSTTTGMSSIIIEFNN